MCTKQQTLHILYSMRKGKYIYIIKRKKETLIICIHDLNKSLPKKKRRFVCRQTNAIILFSVGFYLHTLLHI